MIYIPSFSAGTYGAEAKKNSLIGDKLPVRFYSKDYAAKFRHPYFLVTAGHNYRNENYFEQMGFDSDCLVLGDSGGFQIASGVLKYTPQLKEQIFTWLENNSTVAINLDIPPRMTLEGKFDECMDISKENFKYFYEHQTGKTKFLNVIQGMNEFEYGKWYNGVKDFQFNGWAIGGGAKSIYRLMCAIMTLIENKEYRNPMHEYIHILGATRITHFMILQQLQHTLQKVNPKLTVTVDSSTPSLGVVYGLYYIGFDLRKEQFQQMKVPKIRGEAWDKLEELDFIKTCEFDNILEKAISFKEMLKFTSAGYNAMILHNFYYFKHIIDICKSLVNNSTIMTNDNINSKTFAVMKSIEEMVDAAENGMSVRKVFNKYVPVYMDIDTSYSDVLDVNVSNQIIDNFFKF